MNNPQLYSKNLDQSVILIRGVLQKHKELLKWNSEPESILDLGIGDGRMAKEVIFPLIPSNIDEYIGGDISETMIASVKKMISHEKFKTIVINAQTTSIPSELKNRFDHIFSNFLLHHTQDVR